MENLKKDLDIEVQLLVKEWGSVIEAAKALQIDSSAIAKCCRHVPKYKRAGGYVWEYKENYGD